jgi:hypothetical protein
MDFYAILDQVIALLRQRQRVTYRALKVQFQLEDDALEALKEELIEAQHLAADEAGRILVWIGDAGTTAPASSPSAATQDRAPLTYTPPYTAMPRRSAGPTAWSCRHAWGSILGKSSCGRLATTCTWTILPWGRPPTWRRVWNSSPPQAVSG